MGIHAARRFTSIEFSFDPCNINRDCPRGVSREGQNVQKNVLQEGWLSPTERASVSAISLAHYLVTSTWRESRRYVVASSRIYCGWRHLATSRESKAHFVLHWLHPRDNRGKFYTDRKRIQCLSNTSQHVPIYLQPFPSNSTCMFKSSPF